MTGIDGSMRERMLAAERMLAGDPELAPASARAQRLSHEINTMAAQPIAIGDTVWLAGGVIICPGVTVGGAA